MTNVSRRWHAQEKYPDTYSNKPSPQTPSPQLRDKHDPELHEIIPKNVARQVKKTVADCGVFIT